VNSVLISSASSRNPKIIEVKAVQGINEKNFGKTVRVNGAGYRFCNQMMHHQIMKIAGVSESTLARSSFSHNHEWQIRHTEENSLKTWLTCELKPGYLCR
jgi:HKD family nuclease